MAKRRYTLNRRAVSRDETRARIVDATVALHEELGPRNATISAIAERAGVQRLTVYRHFPDETALFAACTGKWLEDHPPPQPLQWADADPGIGRCTAALAAFYRYYAATRRMWEVSFRDEELPALREPMREFRAYVGSVANELAGEVGGGRQRRASIGHALSFTTWASLHAEGLAPDEAAGLVARWIGAVD